ncbi:MAG: 4-hydroxy-tetrahydrodipicolinate reductase [Proteobacteria bacterium]|nr:4-hydroxy-tetrahydrodipicolinate reductase [Pseudomonadota bacterium]
MLRLAIAGTNGRMGKALVQAIFASQGVALKAGTVSANSLMDIDIGTNAGCQAIGVKPVDDLRYVIEDFDILIDFTTPLATLSHLRICQEHGKKMVIGTTGFNAEQKTVIQEVSQDIALVFAPNTSVGVNLCYELVKLATKILGDDADIDIIEAHHRQKADAPSGTALEMGELICKTLHRDIDKVAVYDRHGITGVRDKKSIGFSSIRAADIVGEHTVIFASEGERIEITHKATSRSNFAFGAIRAAKWLENKQQGLYSMADVLFEKSIR